MGPDSISGPISHTEDAMNRTIYVRDIDIWKDTKILADEHNLSMSALIEKLLQAYVALHTEVTK